MTILVIGQHSHYDLYFIKDHINTSATGKTTSAGDKNFGINGTVPTAGITLIHSNTLGGLAAGRLATLLNTDKYDIVLAGYDHNAYNAADVIAAVNYVNRNGVLFLATEGFAHATSTVAGATIRNIMAQLFGLNEIPLVSGPDLWYAGSNTNQIIYQVVANTDDPILNGPFGDITGKYLGGDVIDTGRLLVGELPATAKPLSTPTPGALINPLTLRQYELWYAVRHSSLGFVWAGDSGFWGSWVSRSPTSGGHNSPINSASPLNSQGWTATNTASAISGAQVVYNGQFLMNFLGYGIKYSGTHSRK
jgi:hypothetical protein